MADESTNQVPLQDLIGRVAIGDRAAFDALYARTSGKLFAVILRIVGNRAASEEVLQESYLKIWRNAGKFRRMGASPMSWLIAIARNGAIDWLRRNPDVIVVDDGLDKSIDDAPTPEQMATLSSDVARLYECLDELEPQRAQLIKRAYFTGCTYTELANATKTPVGTVKSWIRRSLLKLRDCIEAMPAARRAKGDAGE